MIDYEFYHPRDLRIIFDRIREIAYHESIEELDCSKSWLRVKSDKTYEEVFDMLKSDDPTLFYRATKYYREGLCEQPHYEFCLDVTIQGVSYFIYLKITENMMKGVVHE